MKGWDSLGAGRLGKGWRAACLGLLLGNVMLSAQAAGPGGPLAVVDTMQVPSWVERGGQRLPLVPGMVLANHDRVVTGDGARIAIGLADGSSVKLGENASARLNALSRRDDGVFTAGLDLAQGAFRLTSDIFERYAHKRAINIRVGTMTAGIRGTDLWGRTDGKRDFVCLIEGNVLVVHSGGRTASLDQPYQCFGANKQQAPDAVSVQDRVDVVHLAITTDAEWGNGSFDRAGEWAVRLAIADNEPEAKGLLARVRAAGFPSEMVTHKLEGRPQYEVRVGPIASERDAKLVAAQLAQRGLAVPQVLHQAMPQAALRGS